MKQKLSKWFGHLLTVLIVVQTVLCVVLLLRGENTALFGYRFYYIVSPSMEPEIPVGSQIVVKETDPAGLKVGDVITFMSRDPAIAGRPNTHRIEEITTDERGQTCFVTKGDNNLVEDPYLVYPEEIYGRVVAASPALTGLVTFYSFASTPMGFVVVVVMPLLLVMSVFCRQLIGEFRKAAAEMAAPEPVEATPWLEELVRAYIEAHPGRELTPEEAAALAAQLLQEQQKEGDDGTHGTE